MKKLKRWQFDYLVILTGQAISLLSSSVLQMVLIWHLTFTTQSALVLSLASIAGFLPQAIIGILAGTLVDRWNRKTVMIVADLFIAAVAASLAVYALFASVPVWLIYVVLFLRSCGTAFHQPALGAVTPLIVPAEYLTKAAGYSQSLQSASLIIGPALAAILYPIWSMSALVALDVVGALIGSVTVALVTIPAVERAEVTAGNGLAGIFADMKAGLRTLQEHRALYQLMMIGAAFMFVFGPINALFPLMSIQHFGGTTTHASIAEVMFAVGMLVGGLALGVWGGFRNRAHSLVLAIGLMGFSLSLAGGLPANGFIIFAAACLLMGLSAPLYNGTLTALFQEKIAPEFLGRVFGLYGSVLSLAMPFGLVVSGIFADSVGVARWFFISGLIIMGLAGLSYAMPDIRRIGQ